MIVLDVFFDLVVDLKKKDKIFVYKLDSVLNIIVNVIEMVKFCMGSIICLVIKFVKV